jgi:hypothetical protein
MKPESLYLIVWITLLAISAITSITASSKSTESKLSSRELINRTEPISLTELIGLEPGVNISRVLIVNKGSEKAVLNVSCANDLRVVELETGGETALEGLQAPCWLIPLYPVNISVTVETLREVMPYAWLSIVSIMCFVLSLGVLFLYLNIVVFKKTRKQL